MGAAEDTKAEFDPLGFMDLLPRAGDEIRGCKVVTVERVHDQYIITFALPKLGYKE